MRQNLSEYISHDERLWILISCNRLCVTASKLIPEKGFELKIARKCDNRYEFWSFFIKI
jgi:hypothetical protein